MKGRKPVELLSKVDVDVFNVNKLNLDGVSLDMSHTRALSNFRLLSANIGEVAYKL